MASDDGNESPGDVERRCRESRSGETWVVVVLPLLEYNRRRGWDPGKKAGRNSLHYGGGNLWGLMDSQCSLLMDACLIAEPKPHSSGWLGERHVAVIPGCPPIDDILVFPEGKRTEEGRDLAAGVPYLVFDTQKCFEERLSPAGEALAKHLRFTTLTRDEWINYM